MRGTTWGMDEDKHENHWRRTFCQIPFPQIYNNAENGKRSLHRLVEFFRRKAEAERGASEELRSVLHTPIDSATSANLDDLEEPGSSVRRVLSEVKNYVDANSHQQLLLARVLEEQVAEPLMSLQEASEMYIHTLQGEIRNVNDEYNRALAAHDQSAARLRKASEELQEAKDRQRSALHGIGVPAFELQRLAVRVNKAEDEVAQAELTKAQVKTVLYNRIISRDEMAMAVSVAYQKAEEERLDQLHSCMERFLHIEKERVKAAEKMLRSLETHVANVSRAEDIQLLIHNHRNPDNMHFQGKALALLDWHWGKTLAEREHNALEQNGPLRAERSSGRRPSQSGELFTEPIVIPSYATPDHQLRLSSASSSTSSLAEKSPHRALAETPLGKSLHSLFAVDSQPTTPTATPPAPSSLPRIASDSDSVASSGSGDGDGSSGSETDDLASAIDTEIAATTEQLQLQPASPSPAEKPVQPLMAGSQQLQNAGASHLEEIVQTTCQTHSGRAMFVKCLNRQRSLETRVKDKLAFETLVTCFHLFLDHCMREDDVKVAKTAMMLAETFYLARKDDARANGASGVGDGDGDDDEANDQEVEQFRRERGGSWGFAQHALGRATSRIYVQENVKTHEIWKNPAFWEKALLLAIGEELHKTPQPCAWEDLPSGMSRNRHHSASTGSSSENLAGGDTSSGGLSSLSSSSLYTREEAVSRVHNIVFGQLGSFTLSMLEFDVPFIQIESFVETMCDAHELTEDQRFLLRKNLQEIFASLK